MRGAIADVWAPYDFYVDGELSDCGVDVFQLARAVGRLTRLPLVRT